MSERCDSCGQKIPSDKSPARVCYDCQKPIISHHKWMLKKIVLEANPLKVATVMVHRHCDRPYCYHSGK